MLLVIPSVISPINLKKIRQLLKEAEFVDVTLSAGSVAKRVKHNEEVSTNDATLNALNTIVMKGLTTHPEYLNAVLPHRVAAPFYARYSAGMQYGDHIDDPVMGPAGQRYRTDVSVTVFLSGPDEYEGGELVIHTNFGVQTIKLPAGDAVIYPSGSLHHVNKVSTGERLVAVTWVQSLVRDPAQRELLYTLNKAREHLLQTRPDDATTKQVDTSYINLMRMWSEL